MYNVMSSKPWRVNGAIPNIRIIVTKKLHAFEVTHVTDSHWYDGYRAFMRGAPDTDNPFPHMSPGYFNWANGWFTARQDYIEQKSRSSNPARPENS